MGRTSAAELEAAASSALAQALEFLGFRVERPPSDGRAELVVAIDDRKLRLDLQANAYGTGPLVTELIARPHGRGLPVLVADKITAEARHRLNDAGWSWLDRRGRLHVTAPGIRLDVDVPADERLGVTPARREPIGGPGGLAVAYWLCSHPGEAASPNGLAPELGFAPSTISTANRRLGDAGLIGSDGTGLFPELFWELAAAWRPERTWVATLPVPPSRLADALAQGWRLSGTAAAAAYGAPVVSAGDGPVELYLPGPVDLSVARRRLHAAEPGTGAASLAVAPVQAVWSSGDDEEPMLVGGWPVAPVLAVTLDLAQDRARGHQVLEDWEVDGAIWR